MATPRRHACGYSYLLLHHHLLLALLLLLPCCLLLPRRAAAQPQPAADDEVRLLLRIKSAWGDPAVLAAWNTSSAAAAGKHCAWPYVRCDAAGRVTSLTLANTNVTGPFPDAVGGLSGLTYLDVSNNIIADAFPTSLYRCGSLQYLNLSQNYFTGDLPVDIGRDLAENLTTLDLNGNLFTGTIPASLSRLRNLRYLALNINGLNGTIPASLSSLRNLRFLALSDNKLTGTIPSELSELTNLQTLYLANNSFDAGELPASFKNLTSLTSLWASNCNLVGGFPSFVVYMPELEVLDLSNNSLTGSIPPGVWSLKKLQVFIVYTNNLAGDVVVDGLAATSLTVIDLSVNKLTGIIPEAFGRLENLTDLYLFRNNFSGEIPAGIGRLPSLGILRVDNNRLTGTLPPELGKHSPGLVHVEADDNELTGTIPEGLCDGGRFQALTASHNSLNGSIPSGLASCATLQSLYLDSNQLSGEVPEALWTATELESVLLRNNRLNGSLPATMYNNLTILHIDNNHFGGNIPAVAAALQVFTAGNNQFSGEIPASLGDGMPVLLTLNLSGNQLSGGIPSSVAKLRQLTQMDMSRNQLSGEIPAGFGAMPVLNVLDLSSNKLSGNIPPPLAKPNLNSLNLSSNQLSGQVPAMLATAAYDQSFLDNPGLCTSAPGSGYLAGVRPCRAGTTSSGGVSHALRTSLLAAGAALLLIAVAFAFFVVRDVRTRRRLTKRDDWKMTPFQAYLEFGDAAILRGLTEENLIGRGGSGRVYRVAYTNRLNGSAGAVAVKQIRVARGTPDDKLEREFESEAGILGNVRHSNIVRLLCCLSGAESKLLVYDYMENGSLDRWLHGAGDALGAGAGGHAMAARARCARRAQFDWPTRLRVAVGAAQGLFYMHHECSPPIVHRDVKTSNILLDSEFRAKVADFGLARMLVRAGAPETMSAVAGSFGYMAPECAYTRKVNDKVDVYSFGVVLLELTTGRQANDGGEHGCLADWARHHYQSGGSIPDATDKCIRYAGHSDEIEVVFRLGVMCTGSSPSSRPTMKDVLHILLKCREQSDQKSKTEHSPPPDYEAAPFLMPPRGSGRKQLSDGSGIGNEESIV